MSIAIETQEKINKIKSWILFVDKLLSNSNPAFIVKLNVTL